jgi:protein involved in polysaccharide export with SLBB domain
VYRREGAPGGVKVDLGAIWKNPADKSNFALVPYDTILIDRAPLIYIGGEVHQPGAVVPRPGYRLQDYLGLAGGFTDQADTKAVVVTSRDGRCTRVNMESPEVASTLQQLEIGSGDSIQVPKRVERVYVGGEVRSPGDFEVRPGRRVSDYLGLAGGVTERADGKRALLFRGSEKPTQSKVIDLGKVLSKKGDHDNIELRAGDMVYVPQKFWANRVEDWGILGNLVTSVAILLRLSD